jgi:hypothetical protein
MFSAEATVRIVNPLEIPLYASREEKFKDVGR